MMMFNFSVFDWNYAYVQFSVFDWNYAFSASLVQKVKIVRLNWALVSGLIQICRIQRKRKS